MKKLFIFVTLFSCLVCTKAKCDNVVIKGDTLWTIFFSPFDSYPGIGKLRARLRDYSTNCTEDNCSFLSTWKIVNNRLMLTKIESCKCNEKKQTANLKNLFGGSVQNGMLSANWYTGEIWVTKDQPNSWAGLFAASWPAETRLIVKKGIVISIKNFVYPKPVTTVYYKNTDSLNKFIYTHIDWKKFHDLPQQNKQSYFYFSQDSNGYLINVTQDKFGIPQQTYNKEEMEEINRVLGSLQWPLFYYHGQPVKSFYGLALNLTKEVQDKFVKEN